MTQEEINKKEWENPDNWHGPKWISFYCSKKDSRIFVAKQIPWMGLWSKKATPNFGQPLGIIFFVSIITVIIAVVIFILKISRG